MKFIKNLLSRKSSKTNTDESSAADLYEPRTPEQPDLLALATETEQPEIPKTASLKVVAENQAKAEAPDGSQGTDIFEMISAETPAKATDPVKGEKPEQTAAVNIWDIDGEDAAEAPAPTARSARRRRNQTRVIGFNSSEESAVSAFDKAEKVAPAQRAKFPVGWMLVSDGPGRGECFTLEAGMSQIGRADDQAIQLDFGDASISRVNHAAVVYDADTHTFMFGHGGKKNIVRLNGKPVISNEEMNTGDEIKIGETTLRFVALCTEDFNWTETDTGTEEHDDVAIA